MAAAALVLLLAGDYRHALSGFPLTIRWTHATFGALAIAAIRHAARPVPSLFSRLEHVAQWLARHPAFSHALLVFALTRPTVLLVGLLGVATIGFPEGVDEPGIGRRALSALPARFDANWYAGIAAEGYDWQATFKRQQNVAFFPAYPMLVRAVAPLSGAGDPDLPRERRILRLAWCGLVISLASFLCAAWLFGRLAGDVLGAERGRDAVVLLASYPFAVFYSAAYTESLFLLVSLGAWYAMRREQLATAAVCGALAGLTRPNGFLLAVPLLLTAVGVRGADGDRAPAARRAMRLAAAAMPVAGMLLFTFYLFQRTGVWFAWARMHGAWGRVFTGDAPLPSLSAGLLQVATARPYDLLNALGVVFALGLIWPVWRRLGPAWAAFVIANLVPPLLAGGVLSLGRVSSTLFPLFLALAAIVPSRVVPLAAATFGILQGLVAVLFYTWRSLY
ncbi:MAG TPA: mannosyltransferase family protein [Vicinamibacterales bacterium]|nr:mannosyltransferase family protein [Vicinamibacterales bacterium]